jgi:hypothetical protein
MASRLATPALQFEPTLSRRGNGRPIPVATNRVGVPETQDLGGGLRNRHRRRVFELPGSRCIYLKMKIDLLAVCWSKTLPKRLNLRAIANFRVFGN